MRAFLNRPRECPFSTTLAVLTPARNEEPPPQAADAGPSLTMKARLGRAAVVLATLLAGLAPAAADKIKNPTAVFSGLDKITGRIISFEVEVDETVQFGALQLTPRVCYTRPPTESPQTTTFVEVDEVTLDNKYRRIFTGWMFAASPGLHGIEHPIYDIWLTDCKGGTEVIVEAKEPRDEPPPTSRREERERLRRQTAQPGQAAPSEQFTEGGRLDVAPPRGVPVQPRQAPSRRFFPTNPLGGPDPAGNNR